MFWLIETQEQFDEFKSFQLEEVIAIPVERHPEQHPGIYAPLCLYIKDVLTGESFLLNFFHDEALQVDILQVREWLRSINTIYVINRKRFNYFLYTSNSINVPLEIEPFNNLFSRKYRNDPELNNIIPIVKHFEYCETIALKVLEVKNMVKNDPFRKELEDIFWVIERNALKVSTDFKEHFNLQRPFLSLYNTYIFNEYNLDNITGRPTNHFNSINFVALNKDNGCREVFIPRNDFLLELDLVSYHPTLISKLVGYQSTTGDIYLDFGNEYGMGREEAKKLVFQQLYGNVFETYKDFKFFKLTTDYINNLWSTYNKQGYIEGVNNRYTFYKDKIPKMNPAKLFNYYIQNYETINNVELLKEMLSILKGRSTKIILYVYDAFLLDTSKEDKESIQAILELFKKRGLKVTLNAGKNYGSLIPL